MVQYVPIMMAPQSLQMFPTQLNQPVIQSSILMSPPQQPSPSQNQPSRAYEEIAPQDRLASQLSHHRELSSQSRVRSDDEDRHRDYGAPTIPRADFNSIRSLSSVVTRGGECDSRMLNSRCDQVPSVYSTISVASRIRNMPVPNNNRDVDRFLDEVFDQQDSSDSFASDVCTMREYVPSAQGTPSVQRSSRPYEGVGKANNGIYEPQQMVCIACHLVKDYRREDNGK
ncbi:unnamed protein product [Strongylus vulgaris]|uniref:Uncharacterized protein n=1 Tax=Strongylus vulgaris TaxID=40348 RepID=A0A3P7LQI0_STRVU|nr:unnamed protein product [Strongylus vulgaris]